MEKRVINNIKNIFNNHKFINILMGILIPMIFVFITEYIQTQSVNATFMWIFGHTGLVFLNCVLMYFIFWGFQTLFNRTLISYRVNCYFVSDSFFDFSFKI